MTWLLVAVGGALGSVARYGAYRMWPSSPGGWPVPTFTVNLVGSFAIGLLYMYVAARGASADNRLLRAIGGDLWRRPVRRKPASARLRSRQAR